MEATHVIVPDSTRNASRSVSDWLSPSWLYSLRFVLDLEAQLGHMLSVHLSGTFTLLLCRQFMYSV